jgi:hypothetical protein
MSRHAPPVPAQAIEVAELAERGTAHRNQLGLTTHQAGRRDAEAAMTRRCADIARAVTHGVSQPSSRSAAGTRRPRPLYRPAPPRLPRPGHQTRTGNPQTELEAAHE